MITIREETMAALGEYTKVSIAFTVESKYVAVPNEGSAGWTLTKEPVDTPWVKDYDSGEPPTRWLRWDTTNWRLISAFSGDERVGGAIVVSRSHELDFLEGRHDLAALWDIRVAPEWRRHGIGSMLFRAGRSDMPKSVGCVEAQDRDARHQRERLRLLCEAGMSAGERYSRCVSRLAGRGRVQLDNEFTVKRYN